MGRLKLLALLLFSVLVIQSSLAAVTTQEKAERTALYQAPSVLGCCANPLIAEEIPTKYCNNNPLQQLTANLCCPTNGAYDTASTNDFYPESQTDCFQNFWNSASAGGCQKFTDPENGKCISGCCNDAGACSGKTRNVCEGASTDAAPKYWALGFPETNRDSSRPTNPCYNTEHATLEGEEFAACAPNNQIDCGSISRSDACRNSACFWCGSGGTGTCTDSCSTCSEGRTSTSNEHNCVVPTTDITTRGDETSTSCTNLPENSCTTTTGCAWCGSANDNEGGCIASTACNTCQGTSAPVGGRCVAQCSDTIDNDHDTRPDSDDPCCFSTNPTYDPNNEACEPQCPTDGRTTIGSIAGDACKCGGVVRLKSQYGDLFCCESSAGQNTASACGNMGIVLLVITGNNQPLTSYTVTVKSGQTTIDTYTLSQAPYQTRPLLYETRGTVYTFEISAEGFRTGSSVSTLTLNLDQIPSQCNTEFPITFTAERIPCQSHIALNWNSECTYQSARVFRKVSSSTSYPDQPIRVLTSTPAAQQQTLTDEETQWGNNYMYKIVFTYNVEDTTATEPKELTQQISPGNSICGGKCAPNPTSFCQPPTNPQDPATIKATCENNEPVTTNCATLPSFSDGICIQDRTAGALCHETDACAATETPYPNILGLWYNADTCFTENGVRRYCYLESTSTPTDSCQSCTQVNSCFDYKSRSSCERNNCQAGTCEWSTNFRYAEFGKGFCYNAEEETSEHCNLCGAVANGDAENLFYNTGCTQTICSNLGSCFANAAETACNACVRSPEANTTTCESLASESACIGSSQHQITTQEGCLSGFDSTPSSDACSLGVCRWDAANSRCFKDGNSDNTAECAGLSDPAFSDCKKDTVIPTTTIADSSFRFKDTQPYINSDGAIVAFNIEDSNTQGFTTHYAFGTGRLCPKNTLTLTSRTGTATVTKQQLEAALGENFQGQANLYYFTIDEFLNTELIKTKPVYVDIQGPEITLALTSGNNPSSAVTSDLSISLRVDEASTCSYLVDTNPQTTQDSIDLNAGQQRAFTIPRIQDATYEVTATCTDEYGNQNAAVETIEIDRVRIIENEQPANYHLFNEQSDPVELSFDTSDPYNCFFSYGSIRSRPFVRTDLHYSYPLPLIEATEGPNQISINCYEGTDILVDSDRLTFTLDTSPPTTAVQQYTGVNTPEDLTAQSYHNLNLLLTCNDGDAHNYGCDAIAYCIANSGQTCQLASWNILPPGESSLIVTPINILELQSGDGAYTLYYASRDNLQSDGTYPHTEQTKSIVLNLDNEGPTITITAPAANARTVKQDSITLSAAFEDSSDISSVIIVRSQQGTQNSILSRDEFTNTGFTKTIPLIHGTNTITILVEDAAGNSAQQTITIYNDHTPPTISAFEVLNNANSPVDITVADATVAFLEYAAPSTVSVTTTDPEWSNEIAGVTAVVHPVVGDVNNNGGIDVGDSLFITQYLGGRRELSADQRTQADVNQDEAINDFDSLLISRYLAGYVPQLPCIPDDDQVTIENNPNLEISCRGALPVLQLTHQGDSNPWTAPLPQTLLAGFYMVKVISEDQFGNKAVQAKKIEVQDNHEPTFSIQIYDGDSPVGTVDRGTFGVTITPTEQLQEAPELSFSFSDQNQQTRAVSISDITQVADSASQHNLWEGSFTVSRDDPVYQNLRDTQATFTIEGRDLNGQAGTTITSGETFTISTVGGDTPSIDLPSEEVTYTNSNNVFIAGHTANRAENVPVLIQIYDSTGETLLQEERDISRPSPQPIGTDRAVNRRIDDRTIRLDTIGMDLAAVRQGSLQFTGHERTTRGFYQISTVSNCIDDQTLRTRLCDITVAEPFESENLANARIYTRQYPQGWFGKPFTLAAEGTYRVGARAIAGNVEGGFSLYSAGTPFKIVYDTTSPIITLARPTGGFTSDGTTTIVISITDNLAGVKAEDIIFTFDGSTKTVGESNSNVAYQADPAKRTITLTYSADTNELKQYPITVIATDRSGKRVEQTLVIARVDALVQPNLFFDPGFSMDRVNTNAGLGTAPNNHVYTQTATPTFILSFDGDIQGLSINSLAVVETTDRVETEYPVTSGSGRATLSNPVSRIDGSAGRVLSPNTLTALLDNPLVGSTVTLNVGDSLEIRGHGYPAASVAGKRVDVFEGNHRVEDGIVENVHPTPLTTTTASSFFEQVPRLRFLQPGTYEIRFAVRDTPLAAPAATPIHWSEPATFTVHVEPCRNPVAANNILNNPNLGFPICFTPDVFPGLALAEKEYTLRVTATVQKDGAPVTKQVDLPFKVDLTNPTLEITTPNPQPTNHLAGNNLALSYNDANLFRMKINGDVEQEIRKYETQLTTPSVTNGLRSLTEAIALTGDGDTPGDKTVSVVLKDKAGRTRQQTIVYAYNAQAVPLTITSVTRTDDVGITRILDTPLTYKTNNNPSFTIRVAGTSAQDLRSLTVVSEGSQISATILATNPKSFSISIPISSTTPNSNHNHGTAYTFALTATDTFGNTGPTTLVIVRDTRGPIATWTGDRDPVDDNIIYTDDPNTPIVIGTNEDTQSCTYRWDDDTVEYPMDQSATNQRQFTYHPSRGTTLPDEDGTYPVHITCTDSSGNQETTDLTIVLIREAPTIVITLPGVVNTNSVTATVTTSNLPSYCYYKRRNQEDSEKITLDSPNGRQHTTTISNLAEGPNAFEIWCVGLNTRASDRQQRTVTYQTGPLTITGRADMTAPSATPTVHVDTNKQASCRYNLNTCTVSPAVYAQFNAGNQISSSNNLEHGPAIVTLSIDGEQKVCIACRATQPPAEEQRGEFTLIRNTVAPTFGIQIQGNQPQLQGKPLLRSGPSYTVHIIPSKTIQRPTAFSYTIGGTILSLSSINPIASSINWQGTFTIPATPSYNQEAATFTISATDTAGNAGTQIISGAQFWIDTAPPTFTWQSISPTTITSLATPVTIIFDTSIDTVQSSLQLFLKDRNNDYIPLQVTTRPIEQENTDIKRFQITFNLPTNLKDPVQGKLEGSDLAGNFRSYEFTPSGFIVDTRPPEFTDATRTPAPGSIIGNQKPTIGITFSDARGIDTSRTSLAINGNPLSSTQFTIETLLSGEKRLVFTPITELKDLVGAEPQTQGSLTYYRFDVTVQVTVYDQSGNSNTASWTFTIDTRVPNQPEIFVFKQHTQATANTWDQLTLLANAESPARNGNSNLWYLNQKNAYIKASFEQGASVTGITLPENNHLTQDDSRLIRGQNGQPVSGVQFIHLQEISASPLNAPSENDYTITIKAKKEISGIAPADLPEGIYPFHLAVDTNPPRLPAPGITNLVPGTRPDEAQQTSWLTRSRQPTISGWARDNFFNSISLTSGQTSYAALTRTTIECGMRTTAPLVIECPYSKQISLSANTPHTIKITASDKAGNSRDADIIITTDNTQPSLQITNIEGAVNIGTAAVPNWVTKENSVTVKGTSESGATIRVRSIFSGAEQSSTQQQIGDIFAYPLEIDARGQLAPGNGLTAIPTQIPIGSVITLKNTDTLSYQVTVTGLATPQTFTLATNAEQRITLPGTIGAQITITTAYVGVEDALLDTKTFTIRNLKTDFSVPIALFTNAPEGVAQTLQITATDTAGNPTPRSLTIRRDATPPTITIPEAYADNPTFGSNIQQFTITLNDPSGIDPASIQVKEGTTNIPFTPNNQNNPTSITISPQTPWSNAVHTLTINARDRVGNAAAQASLGFTIDSVAPTATFAFAPVPNDVAGTKYITTTAAASSTTVTATFSTSVRDVPPTLTCGSQSPAITANPLPPESQTIYTIPLTNLPQGSCTLTVRAARIDTGTQGTATQQFIVDTLPPRIVISNPQLDASNHANSNEEFIIISGRIEGETGPVTVALSERSQSAAANSDNDYEFSFADVALVTGNNQFTITATDSTSHQATRPFTISADFTAPGITLGAITQSQGTLTIPFTSTEPLRMFDGNEQLSAPAPRITLTQGSAAPVQISADIVTPGTATTTNFPYTAAFTLPADLDGQYSLALSNLRDAAGNTGQAAQSNVALDTTYPTITITSPQAGAVISDTTPTISATITDTSGIATTDANKPAISLDGQSPIRLTPSNNQISYTPTTGLASGQHTVTITATDAKGFSSTATSTFTIDTEAPSLTISEIEIVGLDQLTIFDHITRAFVTRNTPNLQIRITGTSSKDLASIDLPAESGVITEVQETLGPNHRDFTITAALPFTTGNQHARGFAKTFTITGTTPAGRPGTVDFTIVKDNIGPTATLTSPSTRATSSLTPSLVFTTNEVATSCNMRYNSFDGAEHTASLTQETGERFSHTIQNTLAQDDTTTLTVACTDIFNQEKETSINLLVDTRIPSITDVTLTNANFADLAESTQSSKSYILFTGVATTGFQVYADQEVICSYITGSSTPRQIGDTTYANSKSTGTTISQPLATTEYIITCTSKAGLESAPYTLRITRPASYQLPISIISPTAQFLNRQTAANIVVSTPRPAACQAIYSGTTPSTITSLTSNSQNEHTVAMEAAVGKTRPQFEAAGAAYTVSINCRAIVGAQGINPNTIQVSFTTDFTPPAKPVLSTSQPIVRTETAAISGTIDSDVVKVEIYRKEAGTSGTPTLVKTITITAGTTFSDTIELLASKNNTLTAIAYDRANNPSELSDPVHIIQTQAGPTITAVDPATGTIRNAVSIIRATLIPHLATPILESSSSIQLRNAAGQIPGTTHLTAENILEFTPSSALANGQYTATIHAEDILENSNEATTSFTTDSRAPVFTLQSPTTRISNTRTISVAGTVTSPITSATITASSLVMTAANGTITVHSLTRTAAGAFTTSVTLPQDGAYTYYVNATDSLGNRGVSETSAVTIDTAAPQLCFTIGEITICPDAQAAIGTCTDSDGLDYNSRGSVAINANSFNDTCFNTRILLEQACSGTSRTQRGIECQNGCSQGACIAS